MRQSRFFTKALKETSQSDVSINAQLLTRGGFVDRLMAGGYTYLPLGLRVLSKIEQIIREEMESVGGQEILMPALHPREIWDATNRWEGFDVLFRLVGSESREYCLGPTHEEVVTPLAKKFVHSYRDLPKALYQIQTKFRNEARPKSGLLRGREFRMKDLYSFHTSAEDLDQYYDTVRDAYFRVFQRCGVGEVTYLTFSSGGAFSKYSHEFQAITPYGEDTIYLSPELRLAVNREIIEDKAALPPELRGELQEQKAIEVGNIFKLGTRFSDAIGLKYQDSDGTEKPVIMGCFGLGSSRLLATIVEIHNDENGIIWPASVAPYQVQLISLGKDPDQQIKADTLYNDLQAQGFEVLYDDRTEMSAGAKFAESDLIGIPVRLVMSPKTLAVDSIEMKMRAKREANLIQAGELVSILSKHFKG